MSRFSFVNFVSAVALAAAFGTAAAADLQDGPTIDKPACEEGKCPTFTGGKTENPIEMSADFAKSETFASAEKFAAMALDAPPAIENPACEEGKCPTFTSGALKNAGNAVKVESLR